MTSSGSVSTVVDVVETKIKDDEPKPGSLATWCSASWKPILGELISTSLLIFFGCLSCIPINGLTEQSPLYTALGFGLTVMFNIIIFGHLSGAHMNPTVTFAAVVWGNLSIALGVAYVIAQALGATIGYGILVGLAPIDVTVEGTCVTMPHHGLNSYQALGLEIMLTAALIFVCCGLWDPVNEHKQESAPIKFGFTIVGLSLAGGPLTGASMNPARSLAPALWTGVWVAHWTYWIGPFIGAALAVLFYKLTFLKRKL